MEPIFFEKQDGSLCAQHCLNALLQGKYYSAVELAQIAAQVDDELRNRMAEGGEESEQYRTFLNQPSSNMDDSGYFSIEVIAQALRVFNLEILPYSSQDPVAVAARKNPTSGFAYICNYHDHWFTVRKIGRQWFNLNSLLNGAIPLTETYLAMFLTQLQKDGYSIFVIKGNLPECDADRAVRNDPNLMVPCPQKASEQVSEDDCQMHTAIERSLHEEEDLGHHRENGSAVNGHITASPGLGAGEYKTPLLLDLRRQRLKYFDKTRGNKSQTVRKASDGSCEMTEEEMLQAAIEMSLKTDEA